jgi:hypothetical protein
MTVAESEDVKPPRLIRRGQKVEFTIPGPDGDKKCTVRCPTDEEWCARVRRVVTTRRNLGRDATKLEQQHETDSAKELFDKILIDDEPDRDPVVFDEYDALAVIRLLERVDVVPEEIEKRGNVWVIPMITLSTNVIHRLRVPSQKQIFEHERSALQSTGRRHGTDYKSALEPFGVLWDQLQDGFEGYEDVKAVSIVHKHAAIQELLARVNERIESGVSPEK